MKAIIVEQARWSKGWDALLKRIHERFAKEAPFAGVLEEEQSKRLHAWITEQLREMQDALERGDVR